MNVRGALGAGGYREAGFVTEYPEGWEEWAAFLTALLPKPVQEEVAPRGVTSFTGGDPAAEVIVRLGPSSITVFQVVSQPDSSLLRSQRLGTILWRRMPSGTGMALVAGLVGSAREMRLATYRQCRCCEKTKPPEQMVEEDVCLECAKGFQAERPESKGSL
jgi:hypothetical protein